MENHKLLRDLVALGVLALCSTGTVGADGEADVVIRGGRVYTVDVEQPWAEALAIDDGVICYVGDAAGANELIGRDTKVVNLRGGMALPGLHDVHLHALEAGSQTLSCGLNPSKSVNRWLRKVRRCAKRAGPDDWVLGAGFSVIGLLEDGRDPATALDAVTGGRPVVLLDDTSHAAWANSRALELVGYDTDTVDAPGGHIARRPDGSPSGLLFDTANDIVFHTALGTPTAASREADHAGLLWSLKQIRKNGITSLGNARVYWKRGYLDTWNRVRDEGRLTARSTLALWAYPEEVDDDGQLAALIGMHDDTDPMLRINQVKFYDDGISINTTAALLQPYLRDLGVGLETDLGLNYFTEDRLTAYIAGLEFAGFDAHIHAIGDRGVHEALNAIEGAALLNGSLRDGRRHRVTHVELVAANDVPRFALLGVIADAQVAGDFTLPQNVDQFEIDLLGPERLADRIPLRSLHDAGATITLSSDWDVSSLSPFVGMQNALERGAQSMPDLASVIEAYTLNAAFALRQEHLVGSLAVGKRADVTIVDRDLFTTPTRRLRRTKVNMTIVDGEIVYRRRSRR